MCITAIQQQYSMHTSERKEVAAHFSYLVVEGAAVWGVLQEAEVGTRTISQMIQKRLLWCFSVFLHFGRLWFCWGFCLFFEEKITVVICCNCFVLKKEFNMPKLCILVSSLTSSVSLHCSFYRIT